MTGETFVKIAFELQQDYDGYPPDKYETLWAVALASSGLYRIDNIPLYVKGISSEDVVAAEPQDGRLQFVRLMQPSQNSVFRIYVADASSVQAVRNSFRGLGCESEQSYIPKLFAMEVPGSKDMGPIATLMQEGALNGRWEYEEGVLRHKTTPS